MASNTRVGIGFDVHPLVRGRRLVLGGVQIPYEKGLEGWSDADVLVHAVMDALLGAAALGDIGSHFPPGDQAFRNADSLELLRQVGAKIESAGWRPGDLVATILAEAPRLKGFMSEMA